MKLKRLIIAGCTRVCEITQSFRNEGMDATHAPEFTLLEAYATESSLEELLALLEDMCRKAAELFFSRLPPVDLRIAKGFRHTFKRISFSSAYQQYVDSEGFDDNALACLCTSRPDQFTPDMPWFTWIMKVAEQIMAPHFVESTFLTHLPSGLSPLVKTDPEDKTMTRRAFFFAGTSFIADIYEDEIDWYVPQLPSLPHFEQKCLKPY